MGFMCSSVSHILYRGQNGSTSRSNWTRGVHLLLEGVCTSISKKT